MLPSFGYLTLYLTVAFEKMILEYIGNSKPKCRKAMADGSNLAPDLRSGILLCVLSLLKLSEVGTEHSQCSLKKKLRIPAFSMF